MKKILVINNDFDTMTLLKSWLEKRIYSVQFTGDAQKVFTIIKKFAPDLIIIDVMQNEVLLELKNHSYSRSIPVLLMTGYTARGSTTKAPVYETIEKPFNLSLLEKKIKHLMNGIATN